MLTSKAPIPVPKPTQSYWLKSLPNGAKPVSIRKSTSNGRPHPRLPTAADVVIIGGGISGISTAYHLRKYHPDLQVVLLEARQLSGGATGRNGGLLWPALNAPWHKTVARYGVPEAVRSMAFELQCLRELTDFIQNEGLQGEVRWAPFGDGGFYVYEGAQEMEEELAELEMMQKFGIHTDVKPLGREQTASLLGTDAFAGAVRQPGVARVWAARLVRALARMAAAAGPPEGLLVAEGVRVTEVAPVGEGAATQVLKTTAVEKPLDPTSTPLLQIKTDTGDTLTARRVVHCTNAYGSALLPELRAALVPVRNHVAATTTPGPGSGSYNSFPLDAAFFARHGYVYWSRREDGRLVVGGFRDTVPGLEWGVYDDGSLDERIKKNLLSYLPSRFPDVFSGSQQLLPEVEWTGILGFTQDRFPFVGPVPGRRGQFLAAGFSGHGMTRTFTCGRVLADMVAGSPPDPGFPVTWLPSPGRFGPAQPQVPGPEAAAGAVYIP